MANSSIAEIEASMAVESKGVKESGSDLGPIKSVLLSWNQRAQTLSSFRTHLFPTQRALRHSICQTPAIRNLLMIAWIHIMVAIFCTSFTAVLNICVGTGQ